MRAAALTIAGSDPSGGAGVQADLKTFHQFGVYGAAAITLITVQNTRRVSRVEFLDPPLIAEQIEAVLEDFRPAAVKTGALGTEGAVEAVAARHFFPLVVDPVLISTRGMALSAPNLTEALRKVLLPSATLVTPNLAEAAHLAGITVGTLPQMKEAARRIADFGAHAVLIKGGHLEGDAVDVLWSGGVFTEFGTDRIALANSHGTGCTLSAAITALLARNVALEKAVDGAKKFIYEAIRTAADHGAVDKALNHFVKPAIPL